MFEIISFKKERYIQSIQFMPHIQYIQDSYVYAAN